MTGILTDWRIDCVDCRPGFRILIGQNKFRINLNRFESARGPEGGDLFISLTPQYQITVIITDTIMKLSFLYLTSTSCTSALPTSQVELEISGLREELGELRSELIEERRNLANAIIEVAQMNTILGKKVKFKFWLLIG